VAEGAPGSVSAGLSASAEASTWAEATETRAAAGAYANAKASGPYTTARASTRTMTQITTLKRVAVSVAGAVAGAYADEATMRERQGMPRNLVGQAIANASAQARAQGVRTFTATMPQAFTTVTDKSVVAEAYSTSVAVSFSDYDTGVTNDHGPKGESGGPRTMARLGSRNGACSLVPACLGGGLAPIPSRYAGLY
jgi:hypothetical protein